MSLEEPDRRAILLDPGHGLKRMAYTGPYTVKLTAVDTAGCYNLSENQLPPGLYHEPHTHPEAEAFYVLSGSFEFIIDGETFHADAGSLAYIPPGVPHGFRVGELGGRKINISQPGHLTGANE